MRRLLWHYPLTCPKLTVLMGGLLVSWMLFQNNIFVLGLPIKLPISHRSAVSTIWLFTPLSVFLVWWRLPLTYRCCSSSHSIAFSPTSLVCSDTNELSFIKGIRFTVGCTHNHTVIKSTRLNLFRSAFLNSILSIVYCICITSSDTHF